MCHWCVFPCLCFMLKWSKAEYSFLTEMFTVWVSAADWEMLEMSVVSAACPDLSWARHRGNPDNAWPRIWLLNPWHLLVTSYNYSGSYNAPGPLIIPPGVIQTPSSLQSYSITPYKHNTGHAYLVSSLYSVHISQHYSHPNVLSSHWLLPVILPSDWLLTRVSASHPSHRVSPLSTSHSVSTVLSLGSRVSCFARVIQINIQSDESVF